MMALQPGASHLRLAAGWMRASAMVARFSSRSRYLRSHSVEQQRRPKLWNSLLAVGAVDIEAIRSHAHGPAVTPAIGDFLLDVWPIAGVVPLLASH
jgi:hypothetical protein